MAGGKTASASPRDWTLTLVQGNELPIHFFVSKTVLTYTGPVNEKLSIEKNTLLR